MRHPTPTGVRRAWPLLALAAFAALWPLRSVAEPYVTPASIHRFNSTAGIRFNDAGGIRFNDAGGIRFNDVGGIRFNDAGGLLMTDASGIRFNDVGGIRFNDAGGIRFNDAGGGEVSIGLGLLDAVPFMTDTSSINVVVSYAFQPGDAELNQLRALGLTGGTIFRRLPMVVVTATRSQIAALATLPNVRSVWADRALTWVTSESLPYIGVQQAEEDPSLRGSSGLPLAGRGIGIAVVDTGIDATHPDLPFGSKVVQNVRLEPGAGLPGGFSHPVYTEGLANTDLVLGHGTFVAGIAAGSGAASGGLYRGVAPQASLVGVSVGDLYIVNVLEGFDYLLWRAQDHGVRVVNCSFATSGPFDEDDPVNIATRALHDSGMTVVFAAGNYGPAPDTLSPYAVAPWVIGVASGTKAGRLSDFSSRGIFNEGLYRPTLTAPGERIISTSSVSLQGVFGVSGGAPPSSSEAVPQPQRWAYSEASGTSFAAPHVAGVVALMLEADPTLDPPAIKRILQATATPMASRDRGETGAGYLDAWAAASAAVSPERPFGYFLAEMLDQRRGRYLFGPFEEFSGTVPAGGSALLQVPGGAATLALTASITWVDSAADLDLTVLDGVGNEVARSASFNALGLFGASEGVTLYHPGVPLTLRVSAKLPLPADVAFTGVTQAADIAFPSTGDLAVLSASDRAAALEALGSLAMTPLPRGAVRYRSSSEPLSRYTECFCAMRTLSRGAAARLVAMAAQLPQTLPAVPSFSDVPSSSAEYAYVESVASPTARRGVVMPPTGSGTFAASQPVTRLDLAVAGVNALGLREEAESWSGGVDVVDAAEIPADSLGHAAIALALGILKVVPTSDGEAFFPGRQVTRMEGARAAAAMLARVR